MVAATGEREQREREREREWAEEAAASLPFVSDSLGAGIMCGGRRKGGEKEGRRERDRSGSERIEEC